MNQQAAPGNGPALYTLIHKGIRDRLFKFSVSAGKLDYADSRQVEEFHRELAAIIASIRLHHTLEEKFIHPLISDRVPGAVIKLAEEHILFDEQLNRLIAHLEGIRTKTTGFEKYRDLGLEFYLAYNRFLAFFLTHIDDEEERVQRDLFDLCTVQELVSTFGRILADQPPEQLVDNLRMVLANINPDELTALLAGAKLLVPEEAYKNALKLAESLRTPQEWTLVKTRLGIK
jgi:hypothetical protein